MAFSSAISQFVREGIKHGVRKDGREWDRIRTIEIETGCFELPDGSARLTLGKQTEVIAAIKIDFTSKSELKSCIDGINSYLHDFDNAEKSVMCTVEFRLETLLIGANFINTQNLNVIPGTKLVFLVDVLVVRDFGNLFDAMCLAVKAAFDNIKLPSFDIPKKVACLSLKDVSVLGTRSEVSLINSALVPFTVTVYNCEGKFFLDASGDEEEAIDYKIEFAYNDNLEMISMESVKSGLISIEDIQNATAHARQRAVDLITSMKNKTYHEIAK